MNEDSLLVAEAFRAGATGYLLKYAAPKELLQAIHEVLKGASYLSPRITSGAVAAMLRGSTAKPEETRELTPRQREVIQLLAEGRSMKEIADIRPGPPNGGCSQVPHHGRTGSQDQRGAIPIRGEA